MHGGGIWRLWRYREHKAVTWLEERLAAHDRAEAAVGAAHEPHAAAAAAVRSRGVAAQQQEQHVARLRRLAPSPTRLRKGELHLGRGRGRVRRVSSTSVGVGGRMSPTSVGVAWSRGHVVRGQACEVVNGEYDLLTTST